jgi:hypothetical protein
MKFLLLTTLVSVATAAPLLGGLLNGGAGVGSAAYVCPIYKTEITVTKHVNRSLTADTHLPTGSLLGSTPTVTTIVSKATSTGVLTGLLGAAKRSDKRNDISDIIDSW